MNTIIELKFEKIMDLRRYAQWDKARIEFKKLSSKNKQYFFRWKYENRLYKNQSISF